MGMTVGKSKGALAEMNVVPLIDILLVLLIIFMVINPNHPRGLDALVPQPSPNQQQNPELENKTEPPLKHDSSTNAVIRRYRKLKA